MDFTLPAEIASDAQKARWLQPIVDGRVRSAFVMTEPHPGAGSEVHKMVLSHHLMELAQEFWSWG